MELALARKLARPGPSKVVFCLVDGLGGLPKHETLRSELEQADISNLDRLAVKSEVGLTAPPPGVTLGERDGVLALLGYPHGPQAELPAFASVWGAEAVAIVTPESGAAAALAAAGVGIDPAPPGMAARIERVRQLWEAYDTFFVSYDDVAAAAFAGDFERKCHALRDLDALVPELLGLHADVLAVGGPRSVPALMGRPTWHPVPFLLHSDHCREGNAAHFNEQECLKGSLGVFPACEAMPLVMAHAMRLQELGG